MDQIIQPAKKLSGIVRLPGDKSISHRALLLSGIAEGTSSLENLNNGVDVTSTMNCMKKLGVRFSEDKGILRVAGKGPALAAPSETLDVGNSGTTIRILSGILAGQNFTTTISGDDSIRRRPMGRIIEPLTKMGVNIEAVENEFAPLTIQGGHLQAVHYALPMASAQVKSCILMAALFARGTTEIREPGMTRDHTEIMLKRFGAQIEKERLTVSLTGPARLEAQNVIVPGDLSAAAFFLAAGCLVNGAEILIPNVGVNPTRKAFISLLCDMGAEIDMLNIVTSGNEIKADFVVRQSKLKGITISGAIIPQIIDELPIIAVMATQAEGVTEVSNARELRVKESDRIKSIVSNLTKMGAAVEEREDGFIIEGPVKLNAAALDSFHDHRIAMAFAVAALVADSESTIQHAECVDISFPAFYDELENITEH